MTHIFHNCEDADAEIDHLRAELAETKTDLAQMTEMNAELRNRIAELDNWRREHLKRCSQ